MKILVTAFGPFDGRAENASSLALRALKKRLPTLRTRVLPVDSVIAPSRLKQALARIQPDVLIMLGEAAGSRTIRLETTAWNEMDFRIPDIAGRQPPVRQICPGSPVSRPSTLPLQDLHDLLASRGHPVSLSSDPGRYLCNQVFYISAEFLASRAGNRAAGFIHLPLAGEYTTDRAAAALELIVKRLDPSIG